MMTQKGTNKKAIRNHMDQKKNTETVEKVSGKCHANAKGLYVHPIPRTLQNQDFFMLCEIKHVA